MSQPYYFGEEIPGLFDGTSAGNSYYVTMRQDGVEVTFVVTDEVIQKAPGWVFKHFKMKLQQKRRGRQIATPIESTEPIKATSERLDTPKEIGP